MHTKGSHLRPTVHRTQELPRKSVLQAQGWLPPAESSVRSFFAEPQLDSDQVLGAEKVKQRPPEGNSFKWKRKVKEGGKMSKEVKNWSFGYFLLIRQTLNPIPFSFCLLFRTRLS